MIHIGNIKRFIEMGAVIGFLDRNTWRTLFPPFKGWDVGCGYCVLEQTALTTGKCERSKEFKHRGKCGLLEFEK